MIPIPVEIRTARLLLRPWRAEDATRLQPILESNQLHLGPWIPARIAEPAAVPILEQRLAGLAADFAASREWRFGLFTLSDDIVLGEVGLFPRSPTARVAFADADRVELGYWLRTDATGRGFITEAARAVLGVASAFAQFSHVEIRCDERNAASAAVPRRLGFVMSGTIATADSPSRRQLWTSELATFGAE